MFLIFFLKMEQKALIFGTEYIITEKFHIYEKSINIDKADIKRIVLSNKEQFGNKGTDKYSIGYIYTCEGNALSSPLCIKFPQMNAYAKVFDKNNKCVNLLVNDQEILKTNNKIWDKIKNLFERKFDCESVHNDKYIKAKISLYNTNFYGKETPIEGKHYTCFFVKLLDSIVNVDNKYHPRIILKE